MGKVAVTATDLQRADRLLEAFKAKDAKALAFELAAMREEALSCASVRVEREYEVKFRKQPGLPFEAPTERQSTETKGE